MAEFQEVIRQWGRMCKCTTCSNEKDLPMCPIDCSLGLALCAELPHNWTEEAAEQFEAIVIKWAEEHPEPVYPSWCDYLESLYDEMPKNNKSQFWMWLGETPIPREIAKKLDLKPVEGGE